MNTTHIPLGYRLATNEKELQSAHALVYDKELAYWRQPTAWDIRNPDSKIIVPSVGCPNPLVEIGCSLLTALAIAFGIAAIIYVALHL